MLYQHKNSVGSQFFECIRYEDFYWVAHMHRNPELIYVHEGEVHVQWGGEEEMVKQGEYALILPNQIHEYHTPEHSLVDVCIFSQDYTPLFFNEIRGQKSTKIRFTCSPLLHAYLQKELFVTDHTPELYLMKSLLYGVLCEYRRQVDFIRMESKNEELFDQIVRYVDANYRENISLKDMAETLGYEPHYLSRYFHSRIHMHFSQYVNWYRVDAATDLLHSTDLSITEIAARSGFQSIRSFNRVYREFTGIAPSEEARP